MAMASYCCSLVFMVFCLLFFSCGARGVRRENHLSEKEIDDFGHVVPILHQKFMAYFSKANNNSERYLNAVTYVQDTGPFVGGSGDIVVWNENVEPKDESIIGCLAQSVGVYVGYGVFPARSGDTKSRIFISSLEEDEKWWVTLNQVRIGYILSAAMRNTECRAILWGGSVTWAGQKPTTTQMGNGHFPKNDPNNCGAISRGFAINKNGVTNEKPYLYIIDNPKCYDFAQTSATDFQYGGSGVLSPDCN